VDREGTESPKTGSDSHEVSTEPRVVPQIAPPIPLPVIRQTRQREEKQALQERATAPPVVMPPVGEQSSRGSRVTFSQIDVQVINQPAPSLPAASPTAEPLPFGTVESERFKVRLT
jgi:hypothetical protein